MKKQQLPGKGGDILYCMGVSENSVPLNPMVLLIIIPFLNGYFIGNIPNIFRQTHMIVISITSVSNTITMLLLSLLVRLSCFAFTVVDVIECHC